MPELDNELRKEFRDYLWKYFSLHADQRLKTFNFFILIAGGLTAAIVSAMAAPHRNLLTSALALVLALTSYIFWQLDVRTKLMIKTAENALGILDKTCALPEHDDLSALRIFEYEQQLRTSAGYGWRRALNPNLSYSKCFNIVFATFASFGSLVAMASIRQLL